MAHPYTTVTLYENFMGADARLASTKLEGSDDDDVFAQHLDQACDEIDSRLAKRYEVPFLAITDTPTATPGVVRTITHYLLVASLYRASLPEISAEYQKKADTWMDRILEGDASVPGATEVAAGAGRTPIAYNAGRPAFAGRVNDGVDNVTDTNRNEW